MDLELVRANMQKKRQAEKERNKQFFQAATQDCALIIEMLIREFRPHRIYQWGSLLQENEFSSISDIDIAVEAEWDPKTFSAILGKARAIDIISPGSGGIG